MSESLDLSMVNPMMVCVRDASPRRWRERLAGSVCHSPRWTTSGQVAGVVSPLAALKATLDRCVLMSH